MLGGRYPLFWETSISQVECWQGGCRPPTSTSISIRSIVLCSASGWIFWGGWGLGLPAAYPVRASKGFRVGVWMKKGHHKARGQWLFSEGASSGCSDSSDGADNGCRTLTVLLATAPINTFQTAMKRLTFWIRHLAFHAPAPLNRKI